MRALAAVILNTFREATRQPFYYLLLAAGAAALIIMVRVPLFTFYSDTDMYKDLGLSFSLLFLMLAGLLASATGVAREVEDRTAGTILAKSVGRWQFVLGKYLGAMGAVLAATAVLAVVFAVCVYYRVVLDAGVLERGLALGGLGRDIEAFRARQINQALTILPGMVLILLQVGVLSAVATALSTRFSAAASVGLSLGAFLVGHLTVFLEGAVHHSGSVVSGLAQALLTALPFLEIFNINEKLSHTILTPFEPGPGADAWAAVWTYVGVSSLYAAAYAAAAIALGVLLFRRRSLT
jgi:ABC-type transport system involved in multi-copper enzyme maturation permease subunit